jgi:hypothetical protein
MVKDYGSRFCGQCGRLFDVATPGERICASCAQPAELAEPMVATAPAVAMLPVARPAAVPTLKIVKPHERPKDTRKRGPRPKSTAAGRNAGPAAGQRTLPMLRALMTAPRGLTTPQLAEYASSATSWINALGSTRQLMLKQEKRGRVRQAGTAEGNRTRASVVWRITEDGERYVKDADASQAPAVQDDPDAGAATGQRWDFSFGAAGSVSVTFNIPLWPSLTADQFARLLKTARLIEGIAVAAGSPAPSWPWDAIHEPPGIGGDCFLVLAMYDRTGGLTVSELHEAIAAENTSIGLSSPSAGQVRGALASTLLPREFVQRADRGRWEITNLGYRMLDVWCGTVEPDEDDQSGVA